MTGNVVYGVGALAAGLFLLFAASLEDPAVLAVCGLICLLVGAYNLVLGLAQGVRSQVRR